MDHDLGMQDAAIGDLFRRNDLVTATQVEAATAEADKLGVELPIREGLGVDEKVGLSEDELTEKDDLPEDVDSTTDEERELGNRRRPKYGEGWWGRGPTLQPHREGTRQTIRRWRRLPVTRSVAYQQAPASGRPHCEEAEGDRPQRSPGLGRQPPGEVDQDRSGQAGVGRMREQPLPHRDLEQGQG